MSLLNPSDVLTQQELLAVRVFLQRLESELGDQLHSTFLFGSKARQDGDPDSDIDILIIISNENRLIRNTISNIGSRVRWNTMF